jgi:nitrate reductase (cytochrome), electron transfer subunit
MTGTTHEGASGGTRRLVNVSLAIVLVIAALGFVVGTRPLEAPPASPAPAAAVTAELDEVRPPTAYPALRQRPSRPQAVTGDLEPLRRAIPSRGAEAARVTPQGELQLRPGALRQRAERRAYEGAPPTIPHPIGQRNSGACLACHAEGLKVADQVAPAIPHAAYTSCLQCHAPMTAPLGIAGVAGLDIPNSFRGQHVTPGAQRAWTGAPPTIPHTTWQRERCASCHGPSGRPGLRTSHPERQNCQQCHALTHPRDAVN